MTGWKCPCHKLNCALTARLIQKTGWRGAQKVQTRAQKDICMKDTLTSKLGSFQTTPVASDRDEFKALWLNQPP